MRSEPKPLRTPEPAVPAVVDKNVVVFLYDLMRLHLPVGTVRRLVAGATETGRQINDEQLRQMAWDMAYRLQNGDPDDEVKQAPEVPAPEVPSQSWL